MEPSVQIHDENTVMFGYDQHIHVGGHNNKKIYPEKDQKCCSKMIKNEQQWAKYGIYIYCRPHTSREKKYVFKIKTKLH